MRTRFVTLLAAFVLLSPLSAGTAPEWPEDWAGAPFVEEQALGPVALEQVYALATADFDEDGLPDLALAGVERGEALLLVLRHDPSELLPGLASAKSARAATGGALFDLELARAPLPEAPDLLAAGDFDADGHFDLAAAAKGSNEILFLRGDGRGHFALATRIPLGGRITAWWAGEVNRRDGLADLLVAVDAAGIGELQVFEHPLGALACPPETIRLPALASSVAAGTLDPDPLLDIALGAGEKLILVPGRDRKLTLSPESRGSVAVPDLLELALGETVAALAIGDFAGDTRSELAVLTANGNLQFVDRAAARAHTGPGLAAGALEQTLPDRLAGLSGELGSATLLSVRLTANAKEDLLIVPASGSTIGLVVPQGGAQRLREIARPGGWRALEANSGRLAMRPTQGSVRAVLPLRLNADARADLVIADSSGVRALESAPSSIFTVNSTGDSTDDAAGDGICDTGGLVGGDPECTLRAAIAEANASAGVDSVHFNIAGTGPHVIAAATGMPAITEPLTIDGATEPDYFGAPVVEIDGSSSPAGHNGLSVTAGSSTIRGLAIHGFKLNDFYTSGNGIRATTVGGNIIEGNYIGLVAGGGSAPGNDRNGILLDGISSNTVGGTTSAARNVIAGNSALSYTFRAGVAIWGNAVVQPTGNVISGNFIGTNPAGTVAFGNGGAGVFELTGTGLTLGGVAAGAGNLISGNGNQGFLCGDSYYPGVGCTGYLVQGNRIGTTADGLSALGNFGGGVQGGWSTNTVGGTTPAARNVISGNGTDDFTAEVTFYSGPGNQVQGNYVGTDATGTLDLANSGDGIYVYGNGNIVGGAVSGAGNLASGNGRFGILIPQGNGAGAIIQGNLVGTQADGVTPLPNSLGVRVDASNSSIGGPNPGEGNVIAYSGGIWSYPNGVTIGGGSTSNYTRGVRISGNSIHSNGFLAIELPIIDPFTIYGPTANDPGDADVGYNDLQNFPVISSALGNGNVVGTLNSAANTQFTLEFFANRVCDPSGYGEAETFVGSHVLTTDGSGNAPFNITLPGGLTGGQLLTATATDPGNNTSELSPCRLIPPTADLAITKSDGQSAATPGQALTYTIVASNAGPNNAPGSVVTDPMEAPLSGCSWSCSGASGGSCAASGSGSINQTVVLPVGGSVTFLETCLLSTTATAPPVNTATIAIAAGGEDPVPGNNSATDTNTLRELDFGDAPEPGFSTTLANNGNRHGIEPGVRLGATIDGEPDGQPSAAGDGDDLAGIDDEDGVTIVPGQEMILGRAATLRIQASVAGVVVGMVDFDQSGAWDQSNELVLVGTAVVAGMNDLSFEVPPEAVVGLCMARIRYATSIAQFQGVIAVDGEVEDELLRVYEALFEDGFESQDTSAWSATVP